MRRVLITGATGGIGEAVVELLAYDPTKNRIFLTAHPSEEQALVDIVQRCKQKGFSAVGYLAGDVSDESSVVEVHRRAEAFLQGPIDSLICNAGIGRWNPIENVSTKDFDEMFAVNVKGVFLWIRSVLPSMKRLNRGSIVVMSSKLAFEGKPTAAVYCATKHALQGLVSSVRAELLHTQIKVCTICPGAVNTRSSWIAGDPAKVSREAMLQPEDVAKAVEYVLSQSSTCNIDTVLLKPQTDYRLPIPSKL